MTSFAFILGVVPLVIATGAGAEMRQSLGTAVFFGMIGVTVFGLLFTPVFYALCRGPLETLGLRRRRGGGSGANAGGVTLEHLLRALPYRDPTHCVRRCVSASLKGGRQRGSGVASDARQVRSHRADEVGDPVQRDLDANAQQ